MSKNVVVFADGTGNSTERHPSNILRLCRMTVTDHERQRVVYDPGVGTFTTMRELDEALGSTGVEVVPDPRRSSRWRTVPRAIPGLALGYGTRENVWQLYRQLAERYVPGDHVYIFGFSRGAFTARALAGWIHRCGLLRSTELDDRRVREAWCLYKDHFETAENASSLRARKRAVETFRRRHSHPCTIRFLGIFDTVKSVGYLRPTNLPHTRHNPGVQAVRHAVSLGERRSFYALTTWGGLDGDTRPAIFVPACWSCRGRIRWQDVEEVWFAGAHADVGGGYDSARRSPADVSLGWRREEARAHGLLLTPTVGAEIPTGEIVPEHLHDELRRHGTMRDWAWRLFWKGLERCPRKDLDNEPPPPRTYFRMSPAGPRVVGDSTREGQVAVHASAPLCYGHEPPPWSGLNVRLVKTATSPLPIPAVACDCLQT
jgi:uncharacterized protein (DUF2235 family)